MMTKNLLIKQNVTFLTVKSRMTFFFSLNKWSNAPIFNKITMEILDRISNKFAEFRKNKVFCDCKIVFKEKEVFAHRIILSKYSQFFKNLFISSNDAGIFSFKVEYDPLNTLESIIDFFYNNDIIINYSNIIALIAN